MPADTCTMAVVGEEQEEPAARRLGHDVAVATRRGRARVHRGPGQERPLRLPVVQLEAAEVSDPQARLTGEAPAFGVDQRPVGDGCAIRRPGVVRRAERAARRREEDLFRAPWLHGEDRCGVATAECDRAPEVAHAVPAATGLKRREHLAHVLDLANDTQVLRPRLAAVCRVPHDRVAHGVHTPPAVRFERTCRDVPQRCVEG